MTFSYRLLGQRVARCSEYLALMTSVVLLLNAVAAPVPIRDASSYRGNRIQDLTLQLRATGAEYLPKLRRESPKIELILTNHSPKARSIQHLQSIRNELRASRGLQIVVRFRSGAVFREEYGAILRPGAVIQGIDLPRPMPFELPAGGKASRETDLLNHLSSEARSEFHKCKEFCVTAILEGLKIKSNTVFFNGFFDLGAEYDSFKDADEFDRRRDEEIKQTRADQQRRAKEQDEREEQERQRRKEQQRKQIEQERKKEKPR